MRKVAGLVGLIALAGCSAQIISTPYQQYEIHLSGPDPQYVGKPGGPQDPFALTSKYTVTVDYWADQAGTVPYGKGASGFSPRHTFNVVGTSTTITLGGGQQVLPQVSGENIYLQSEVDGYDDSGNLVARARCPVEELQPTSSASGPVVCTAFYGLIGRWNPINGPNTPRYSFAAAALPDGRVVIGGGKQAGASESSAPLASVEVYEPTTPDPKNDGYYGVWRAGSSLTLSKARYELTASVTTSVTTDGEVFFAGGKYDDHNYSDAVDIFDGGSGGILASQQLPEPRAEHASTTYGGNSVLIAGGMSGQTGADSNVVLLTTANQPNNLTSLAGDVRQYGCMAAVSPSEVVYCGGGQATCEDFNGTSQTFAILGNMRASRDDVKCAAVGGAVYLIGGIADTSADAKRIEVWKSGAVTQFDSSPWAALTDHEVAVANGKVVVAGGYVPGTTTPLKVGFWFDPAVKGGEHQIKGSGVEMSVGRADFQMVGLPDGTVMAVGGKTSGSGPGAEIFVVPDSGS